MTDSREAMAQLLLERDVANFLYHEAEVLDAPGLTRCLEDAYRGMHARWLQERKGRPEPPFEVPRRNRQSLDPPVIPSSASSKSVNDISCLIGVNRM